MWWREQALDAPFLQVAGAATTITVYHQAGRMGPCRLLVASAFPLASLFASSRFFFAITGACFTRFGW